MRMFDRLVTHERYGCFLASLASICDLLGEAHSYLFAPTFYFDIIDNSGSIASNMTLINNKDNRYIMNSTTQINYEIMDCTELGLEERRVMVTENVARGVFVIVVGNIFDCPWNALYQKRHSYHNFLLAGVSDDDFICVDTYFTDEPKYRKIDQILLENNIYYIVQIERKERNRKNIISAFLSSLMDYSGQNKQITGEQFKHSLIHMDFVEELRGAECLYGVDIIIYLKLISDFRSLYADALLDLAARFQVNFADPIGSLRVLSQKWHILKNCVGKTLIRKSWSGNVPFVYKTIDDIIELEARTASDIIGRMNNIL